MRPLRGISTQKFSRIRIWYSMFSLLRYSSHLSPMNSLSARRHWILPTLNSLIKESIKSIRSCIEEFPNFGIICNKIGNATPLYTISRVRMLISYVPTFQYVLFNPSLNEGLRRSKAKINLATCSESSEWSDMNRCILRSDNSAFTSESKPQASFSIKTICTLHNALINKQKNFIRVKFILFPRNYFYVSDKIVILLSNLVSIVRNSIGNTILIY